ncbi:hypothetical protein Dimus_007023 [Dionaea muscipula]
MHTAACKEFYANLTVFIYKKKEIARSRVKEVEIEFDSLKRPRLRMCSPQLGESGSDDQFFDAQVDVEEPVTEAPAAPTFSASPGDSTNQQREQTPAGVDPSGPSGRIPEFVMNRLQAQFERARANRFQADLKKAQTENARLLTLLQ